MPPRGTRFSDGAGSSKVYKQDIDSTSTATTGGKAGRYSKVTGKTKVWGVTDQGTSP